MLDQYYYSGRITIKFKCGCSVLLRISYDDSIVVGNALEIKSVKYKPCNKHKSLKKSIDSKCDWIAVLNSVLGNNNVNDYIQLLDMFDHVDVSKDLDDFLKKIQNE